MKQVVLAGLVAGALAAGQPGVAFAQATAGSTEHKTAGAAAKTGPAKTASAPAGATSLGSVRITHAVKANGEPLKPGTYSVRLTPEEAKPDVKGQTAALERWVEFLQGNQVKGREVVSIVPDSEIAQVAESKRVPSGSSRVEMLKGNEYVRVWINRGGNNYLIHLPPA